jgi:hypothetical protein
MADGDDDADAWFLLSLVDLGEGYVIRRHEGLSYESTGCAMMSADGHGDIIAMEDE